MVRHIGLVILALSFAVVTGCHVGCCSKRASEKKCPTDVRKTHCWCFGEDALFRYPCGPNRVYYGHKATCWREWPTSGSHWRDVHCGPTMSPGVMQHEVELFGLPSAGPGPADGDVTNPFRAEAGEAQPLPEMQSPSFTEPGAQELNLLPPAPENAGGAQPG
ncbi:MAG TPA: hypothetical protein VJ828_18280, partial [Lacipirellulaceae bacterium]|nr:hypothetical protein [Lacipirellulaceae bacterium]